MLLLQGAFAFALLLATEVSAFATPCQHDDGLRIRRSVGDAGCPFLDKRGQKVITSSTVPMMADVQGAGTRSSYWWPTELRLDALRQNAPGTNPLGEKFNYAEEFKKLDYKALKADIVALTTQSQDFWPADFGNYGPFFVRMAWHSAGTYRALDGNGGGGQGQERFAPLNSWPDNANLDKARRLLWPIKQKYGNKISWADLMLLTANTAMESMGFKSAGFAAGRPDTWQSDESIYWGGETKFLDNDVRYAGSKDIKDRSSKLEKPLSAAHMGLIYVNPEGPDASGDYMASALDIRETFGRMGMNDEETVALIGGGHAFGKTHGAGKGDVGPAPNGANIEEMGFGWTSKYKSGKGADAVTSGLEVIWTKEPTKWGNGYFKSLLANNWTMSTSPAGAKQFVAASEELVVPDAFDPKKKLRATMLVSDLALRFDPAYAPISLKFSQDLPALTDAFGKAWFKLLHRDLGPTSRYLGPDVPKEEFAFQDPLPVATYKMIDDSHVATLKKAIVDSGVDAGKLVSTAWASASTYRNNDKRGGANGARLALEPEKSWAVNKQTGEVIAALQKIRSVFNAFGGDMQVSLADLIVLGGCVGIEKAAAAAGAQVTVPFSPGRVDATQEKTDVAYRNYLEPIADGFRNYGHGVTGIETEKLLVKTAHQLSLTIPEMTVLIGGMRAINANFDSSKLGVLTTTPGKLTNDFFVNILTMDNTWTAESGAQTFTSSGKSANKWTATRADLVFGSHPELRAVAEVYAQADAVERFVPDFVAAWTKVMNLDRFDLPPQK